MHSVKACFFFLFKRCNKVCAKHQRLREPLSVVRIISLHCHSAAICPHPHAGTLTLLDATVKPTMAHAVDLDVISGAAACQQQV
jgi:hypothetical protein